MIVRRRFGDAQGAGGGLIASGSRVPALVAAIVLIYLALRPATR